MKKVSVVIPCFHVEEFILPLFHNMQEVEKQLNAMDLVHSIVCQVTHEMSTTKCQACMKKWSIIPLFPTDPALIPPKILSSYQTMCGSKFRYTTA